MGNRKGTRHSNRRKLEQAANNVRTAQDYIVTVGHQYAPRHEALYQAFGGLVVLCEMVIDTIEEVRGKM